MSDRRSEPESLYACVRLGASLLLMTIGGVGMYAMAVALAPVQAEFSAARGDASLPYTLTMIGFGIGGIVMGRLSDRFGVFVPLLIGGAGLGLGFVAAGSAGSLPQLTLAHGILIGLLPRIVGDHDLEAERVARLARHERLPPSRRMPGIRPPDTRRASSSCPGCCSPCSSGR